MYIMRLVEIWLFKYIVGHARYAHITIYLINVALQRDVVRNSKQ